MRTNELIAASGLPKRKVKVILSQLEGSGIIERRAAKSGHSAASLNRGRCPNSWASTSKDTAADRERWIR